MTDDILRDAVVFISGGTGSFGQAMTKELLENHSPKAIRIFSRGEYLQWEMQKKINDDRLRFFIGDVRDKDRLSRALEGVDVVFHAAALKQVPTAEYNPSETVKVNVDGALNMVDACLNNNVGKVIAISSDKAVAPNNLYGATKMVMERLFIQANVYSGKRRTHFSCVRYGNVAGSRGSLLDMLWKDKPKSITVTDKRMTRFWLTVEQGVVFVINCVNGMIGGEIFVPKVMSARIIDLLDVLAPNAERTYIGIRPGEKISEVLVSVDDARHTRDCGDYFVILPEYSFRGSYECYQQFKSLPEGFVYTSAENNIVGEQLREMVKRWHTL